ncbi:MAG: class I SAM-dependent methyltransferase [bacterium]|nr:class I SAM-dependent methyltransferase [bacterium]
MSNTKSSYKKLGKSNFYDGMITSTTFLGSLVNRIVWRMNKEENKEYLEKALSPITEDFCGKLLEVPVGTGILTMPLYKKLKKADIVCLDYSPEMMARAEYRADEMNIEKIKFMQGDVGKLPFDNESFDIVLSLNGFHAFPDKDAAYSETYRVLKNDGILCGCFAVVGESKRTDLFLTKLYTKMGYLTPPFETKDSLEKRLKSMYSKVHIETVKSMACFRCIK